MLLVDESGEEKFLPCGYNISLVGWQLVMVVGRVDGLQSSSSFFVNGELVGVVKVSMALSQVSLLGAASQGPGFVALAAVWQTALSEEEVRAFWVKTRRRFGLEGLPSMNVRGRGRRRWTVALSSTPEQLKDRGAWWWMALALQLIMRPSMELEMLLQAARRSVRFRSPALGVHVRHGEACNEAHARKCVQASELLPSIRAMTDRYGLRSVYLATDSPWIMHELRDRMPDLHWMVLDALPREFLNTGWTQTLMTRIGRIDRRLVAESALVDLLLLSSCDALIGQFSSAFFKTAFALALAHKGFVPPYIGHDGPPSW